METLTTNRENIVLLITAVKEGVRLRSGKARKTRLREVNAKLSQGLTVSTDRVIMVCVTCKNLLELKTSFGFERAARVLAGGMLGITGQKTGELRVLVKVM